MKFIGCDAPAAPDMCDWSPARSADGEQVETLVLRDRVALVLSQIETGQMRHFHYIEPEDMFGIGFHLRGGSHFDVERSQFSTQPHDVWAGAAPRGAASSFALPEHGFRTVSLRFSPDAIQDLLQRHGQKAGPLTDMARLATQDVAMTRLGSLDARSSQLVEAMFSPPYVGAARTLFLESCALGLLASQINAFSYGGSGAGGLVDRGLREKMLAAREHLDGHFVDPPTIGSLARIAGTNEFSLKRGFKEAFGLTVFGYVTQRRMQLAADELHAGRSVQDTARAAGYACPRSFADAFRRHFGVLPSSVLRRLRSETPDYRG